ncbi:MAG: alpha-glucan phosphorylase [Verrucomicrobiaceae bacterium]|nr:alpha-glucan phosphorylase [Verrucomicrobiaceae bacterium]
MSGTFFKLEVQPHIPEPLGRLKELANDLLYSWDRNVRRIFSRLDPQLWEACGHNPKVFLRRLRQRTLEEALHDRSFMDDFQRVLAGYDAYLNTGIKPECAELLDPKHDLVAYFCAEFGLHESFPIYSGGLGILAGDHCKAASDLGIPFIGIGLLYRQGYFTQTIDAHGNQIAHYNDNQSDDLPIKPALVNGTHLHFGIAFPGRTVQARVWEAKAGHIRLYLLDTDLEENQERDRGITHRLYGGDKETRIQQEIVLGIGGVRALELLGLKPTVWHINEGHAAFQLLERCRHALLSGLDLATALELVASGTLFTTHTPVPAGHDFFSRELMDTYFGNYAAELGIDFNTLFAFGQTGGHDDFNMTTLALRYTRFHNGVSRIHGGVASKMEGGMWPQVPPAENPIDYITNGVHVPTFLAREWVSLFDMLFSEWQDELLDPEFWKRVDDIPDHHYWSIHKALKHQLLEEVCRRVALQGERNGSSHSQIKRITQEISDPDRDIVVFGFARRFATYKRATLLFSDLDRLSAILNHPEKPGVMIFAGKAHPNDLPGQQLIKKIHELSLRPEFIGKIILLEGYDLALARSLVAGVDVWLNTPEYPLEASGTSGEKAAINGAVNLSVLDGWWGEGFNHHNGWAITPRRGAMQEDERNLEESNDLLDIIEYDLMPLYYQHDGKGYSAGWVKTSKASMKSIIPHFNAQRMVMDYVRKFYGPASKHMARLGQNDAANARKLSAWKQHVRQSWSGVSISLAAQPSSQTFHREPITLQVIANLNGLKPEDVVVESVFGRLLPDGTLQMLDKRAFRFTQNNGSDSEFTLELSPELAGLLHYKIRIYPYQPLLAHPHEMGCMLWI